MAHQIKFGTGGWRAVIGEDFIADNIRRVGQAVAQMVHEDGAEDLPVPIGYDRRFLSDTAAKWLAEVLCANGVKVQFLHRSAPTPLIMHRVKKFDLYCGLEVTASHNPSSYNGIKLIVKEGRDASIEATQRLEKIINSIEPEDVLRMPFEKTEEAGLLEFLHNPFDPFMDDIIEKLDMQAIRNRGMRIAFDPMHGSGTYPLMVILCTARVTVDIIHQNKDAYFGAEMPAPTRDTLEELARKVRIGGYDLGIAFDGDGDRVGIIDEKGRYVSANEILAMLYWYLHEFKGWKGPVVRNQSTTHMLDRIAESFGEECHEVPVGFKHISSKIDETDAVLGGESSGGLTVRGHIFGKDSIYASCLFVEMLSATGMTTSQILEKLHEKYGSSAFLEEAFTFAEAEKARIAKVILEDKVLPALENVEKVGYTDGCKVYFKNGGFVTCRFSGTEPLLRLMAEAPTEAEGQIYINAFKGLVQEIISGVRE